MVESCLPDQTSNACVTSIPAHQTLEENKLYIIQQPHRHGQFHKLFTAFKNTWILSINLSNTLFWKVSKNYIAVFWVCFYRECAYFTSEFSFSEQSSLQTQLQDHVRASPHRVLQGQMLSAGLQKYKQVVRGKRFGGCTKRRKRFHLTHLFFFVVSSF